jgi:hypothetical protein
MTAVSKLIILTVSCKNDYYRTAKKRKVNILHNYEYLCRLFSCQNIFLLFMLYRVLGLLGECSEDEDSFHYSIRGSTTKVDASV